jgi:hypothetical protein
MLFGVNDSCEVDLISTCCGRLYLSFPYQDSAVSVTNATVVTVHIYKKHLQTALRDESN